MICVGVCMGKDRIRPSMAINKEIDLRFVVGDTPLELRDTLYMLADGKLDATSLLTGSVGLAIKLAPDDVLTTAQAAALLEPHIKPLPAFSDSMLPDSSA